MPTITPKAPAETTLTVATMPKPRPVLAQASPAPAQDASNIAAKAPPNDAPGQPLSTPQGTEQAPVGADKAHNDRMAQLARKERAIRQREQELKAREAAILKPQEPAKAIFDPKEFKAQFLKDPASVGVSMEDLQAMVLGQMAQSPEADMVRGLQAQVEALKTELQGTKKSIEETQTTAYQQAIKKIDQDVDKLVTSNPDAYELIHTQGRQKAVTALIERTYKEDGILLDTEEAAKQVEEELLDRALKLVSVGKVKAKALPSDPNAQPAQASAQQHQPTPSAPQQHQPPQTLTSAMSQASSKALTPAQRRERAILAFQGKLG